MLILFINHKLISVRSKCIPVFWKNKLPMWGENGHLELMQKIKWGYKHYSSVSVDKTWMKYGYHIKI
jgi:hypothetical protein